MFTIVFRDYAIKKAVKLVKKNIQLKESIAKSLYRLKNNPFDQALKTHKVNSRNFGVKYSSSITGNLRFIWDFDQESQEVRIIEILDIGGHSGSGNIYN